MGKTVCKIALKITAFLLVFVVLFFVVQNVLRYKLDQSEYLTYRYESYEKEKEGSIDALFLGSSPVYAGVVPMIIWEESGITSINFGASTNSAFLNYYELKFALESQTPQLVLIDFCSLFEDRKADDIKSNETYEVTYRKAVESMPSWEIKTEIISELKESQNQDPMTYYFPLLRYHTRWTDLTEKDFSEIEYLEFKKGALLKDKTVEIKYNKEIFESGIQEAQEYSEYSYGYYQKIMSLCRENNIQLAAVSYPRIVDEKLIRQYNTIERVCEENGIDYYNFNTPEMWERYQFDTATDFYNGGHMNLNGSIKLSQGLAEVLADYGLQDHRGDEYYGEWDENWNAFSSVYEEKLKAFGY